MLKKAESILKDVLEATTPSEEETEAATKTANIFLRRLNKQLKPVGATATIQGSFHKNTQLKHTFDIDVFAHFDYKKYSKNDSRMSDILESKLKKLFRKFERVHGSRDYFKVRQEPYLFEIVPTLRIASYRQAKNITDVSPLHAKWVMKKAKHRRAQIRLTKAFLSALGIYGAESYVRGFSGYACEVLTIHYGSFIGLLKEASKWKEKTVIDPEKAYKKDNPLSMLNQSKTVSPLVIVDPVQPSRNVTAALSDEAYKKFISASMKFLKSPSKDFFVKKYSTKKDLLKHKSSKASLLIVELDPIPNKHDVVGAAILSKYEYLRGAFTYNNFKLEKSGWFWEKGEKGAIWFLISKKLPPKFELRKGPSLKDKENSKRFRAKHRSASVKKGRLYAKVNVKFTTPKELTKSVLRQSNFKNRMRKMRVEWH